jgi:glutamate-1-semialdehyde 2,1-aminomutase
MAQGRQKSLTRRARSTPGKVSQDLFSRSLELIPGGVNSPVRSFASVGGRPFLVERGRGARLVDVDGKAYVDYVMSWGPLILGHAPESVVAAVRRKAGRGTSFGAPTKDEVEIAALVRERMPWVEKLRLMSSGTEACMTAVRIARGATGRDTVVKFDGCYHGHSDAFLVRAGSGLATGGLPGSAGVPESTVKSTVSLPYNDAKSVNEIFEKRGKEIAAVIVEPVAANMGVVPPEPGFLGRLRELATGSNAVLIFDEVITGFRVAQGGAADLYGVKPDLVCLGKILGGGLPIGAVGGARELMDHLAPVGPVYQAGTLSGNPLSTAAGIATLKALGSPRVYRHLEQYACDLTEGIDRLSKRFGVAIEINRVASLFTPFFSGECVTDFASAQRSDAGRYAQFFSSLLQGGVFIPPSRFEAWFVSRAHGARELSLTLRAVERCFKTL